MYVLPWSRLTTIPRDAEKDLVDFVAATRRRTPTSSGTGVFWARPVAFAFAEVSHTVQIRLHPLVLVGD